MQDKTTTMAECGTPPQPRQMCAQQPEQPVAFPESVTRRTAANRRNSEKSTGPLTAEGKERSSRNATKFGLFSKKALVQEECWEDFQKFSAEVLQALNPTTPMQRHVAELYVACCWRARRLPEMEAGLFERYGFSTKGVQCGSAFALVASIQEDDILGKLARYNTALFQQQLKMLSLFRAIQKEEAERSATPRPPAVIDVHAVTESPVTDTRCEENQIECPPAEPPTGSVVVTK